MKKTILSTALLTILGTTTYADNSTLPTPLPGNTMGTKLTAPTASGVVVQPSSVPAPQPTPDVNCEYRLPAETTSIEQPLISTWAGKATVQSFDFNPATVDEELVKLKSCYTEQGWQGFNDALQKSGNINAIKTQHLTVSSQVDGDVKINPVKDNQWKVTVPIQVVYQNDKEKLTQLLTIDLLIGRKISGDLGIMQMIATPRPTAATTQTPTAPAQQSAPAVQTPAAATPAHAPGGQPTLPPKTGINAPMQSSQP